MKKPTVLVIGREWMDHRGWVKDHGQGLWGRRRQRVGWGLGFGLHGDNS